MNQFCDKCGSQINQTTGTCPNCAPKYAPNYVANNQPQMNKPENKKHTTKEVVAVVVAIALFSGLFGILGYVFGKVQNSLPKSYNEIVERYKLVMAGEDDSEKTLSNKLIDKFKESENYEICYSLTDINDDDVDELIIGGRFEDDKNTETYDIYTMDSDKNAVQIIPVNDYDEVVEIEIYNEVIKVSEEKDETIHFEYLKLPENQWEVEKDEEYLYEDEKYFEVIEEEKNEISEETFNEANSKYEGEEVDLEWIKVVLEEDKKEKETETTELNIDSQAYIDVKLKCNEKNSYGETSIIEIPQIFGEENEEINRINKKMQDDYDSMYKEFVANADGWWCETVAIPTVTERYLNLTYLHNPYPTYGTYGDVYSCVYDKHTGKEVTIEEAYKMADVTENDFKQDIKQWLKENDSRVLYEEHWLYTIAFRMLDDGTPQFLIGAGICYPGNVNAEGAWSHFFTWNNGEVMCCENLPFDLTEVDGEYSGGKLMCQKEERYQKIYRPEDLDW